MKKVITLLFFVLLLTGCAPKGEVALDHGVDTVEVFGSHELQNCTVTVDGTKHVMELVDNPVNTEIVGEYIVEYELEIGRNTYECQRVVFVVDQTSPIMTLIEGVDTLYVDGIWVDGGVEVSDNYDQEVTISVFENTIDLTSAGTYQVTYEATDSSGNSSQIIRYVHVLESE